MNLKQYFLDIYSAEFYKDKQKDFFLVQMLMITACSLLNSLWVIKDVFVKGIGPEGNLYLVVLSRLVPTILLIPFIIWSLLNKKVEPFLANILLYINIFMPIFAIHFSGTPTSGSGHMIMSLAIFMLEYASVSGIASALAQILYPFLMYISSQDVLGLFVTTSSPVGLLFSGCVMSVACLISATILRVNYYNLWVIKRQLALATKMDSMTGAWNRKIIDDITNKDLLLEDSTILMVDIDNFKSINDGNGHDFGDKAILDTVNFLKKSFPAANIIRYGGDEFLIIISKNIKLSKIKIQLSSNYFRDDITYSIGVAYGNKDDNIYGIIKRADIALYKSKETKNCVTLFSEILN